MTTYTITDTTTGTTATIETDAIAATVIGWCPDAPADVVVAATSLEQAIRPLPVVQPPAAFAAPAVARALAGLRDKQHLRDATGATHAAAWCNPQGDILLLREDLGRHNALDKLIGALQRGGVDAASGFVVVTSRASYEMVHKTAVAGVALLAAVSGVTSLAVDAAETAGLGLLGFARGQDLTIYSHPEHIALPPTA